MHVQVIPGKLVEVPTSDATGMERRAFGEFIVPQGELASYAFGWTTGADPHIARFSVGIGAGNPGGATFHAVVFDNGDSYAYALVDDPFEQVPQGGPHLTADRARAHQDLPFIWWVIDRVVEHDSRTWWMRHWLMQTRSIQTHQVFDKQEPILRVHHGPDGVWRLAGTTGTGADSAGPAGHLHHAIDEDPTLIEVLDLEPGRQASRSAPGQPWHRDSLTH
ncbi:hypothetical protein [Nocardia sienata]|uniref:hypothetical protein n=1 Tax=Nocardia sienata TaxID=248552 RepID=UPI0007A533F1|nr:hypothetical protein [Nocardia sienata]